MPGASVPSRFSTSSSPAWCGSLDRARGRCARLFPSKCGPDRRARERYARAAHHSADVFFGHRNHQPQAGNLLNHQQRRIGARADQRAGMDQAVRHHAIEGRGDFQIGLQIFQGQRTVAAAAWRACSRGSYQGLRRLPPVSAPGSARCPPSRRAFRRPSAGDRRCSGRPQVELRPAADRLRRPALSIRPSAIWASISGALRFDEQFALFDDAAAVHQHALDIARNLGVQRDAQIGPNLGGQIDGARHGFGDDRHKIDWAACRPSAAANRPA